MVTINYGNEFFCVFKIPLDANLMCHLKVKAEKKQKRHVFQKTKVYKSNRSTNRYAKFAEAHRSQLEENKTGAKYESGVAVKQAKKSLKLAAPRNPKGTLPADWKCPFFTPNFAPLLVTATINWLIVICRVNQRR